MSPPKGPVLEYFPESWIALNREASKHPGLLADLSSVDITDFTAVLAEIAAYCAIALDGMYTPEELDTLCDMLTKKLYDMRKIVIN